VVAIAAAIHKNGVALNADPFRLEIGPDVAGSVLLRAAAAARAAAVAMELRD